MPLGAKGEPQKTGRGSEKGLTSRLVRAIMGLEGWERSWPCPTQVIKCVAKKW